MLQFCQRSIVRVFWGDYHPEDDSLGAPRVEPFTLAGAILPELPPGVVSPSGLPPESLEWVIPSSPSVAVPMVNEVLRTALTFVQRGKRFTRVPILPGSHFDRRVTEISRAFRPLVEGACVDDSVRSHEIVAVGLFFGNDFRTLLTMKKDPHSRELILELTRPDAPMAALGHEVSREVIGHPPRFVPRTFRFFEKIGGRPNLAIEDHAAGLIRFAERVGAANAQSLGDELVAAMQSQLRRAVMTDFLRFLEGQMGNPWGLDNPRRVVTDAVAKAFGQRTVPLNNFADAQRLLTKQAGWESHRRKVASALRTIQQRNVGVRRTMKEEVEVRLMLDESHELSVTFPLTFTYVVEADGTISILRTQRSFFSPYPNFSPADLDQVTEFEYGLSPRQSNGEPMQELERKTAFWLEWAFTHGPRD